jgi:nitrate reductase gamma subunit
MFLLIVLYGALAVFFVGNLVRILRVAAMPVHLRWELYPVPHEPGEKANYGGSYFEDAEWWTRPMRRNRSGELCVIMQEIFLLKAVRKYNRDLWLWSWLLHSGLYLWIAAALLAAACAFAAQGHTTGVFRLLQRPITIASWLAMMSGSAGSLGLVIIRRRSRGVHPWTPRVAYLNLLLLFSIFGSGLLSAVLYSTYTRDMISLAASLIEFQPLPVLHVSIIVHVAASALFLAYFPFTHMTHAYMKYFTYHAVRWDDVPYRSDAGIRGAVERSLRRRVSWAAPHVRNHETKSWLEVSATEGAGGGEKP